MSDGLRYWYTRGTVDHQYDPEMAAISFDTVGTKPPETTQAGTKDLVPAGAANEVS